MNILITGMSGTGKTTVIELLQARGFETIESDSEEWSEFKTLPGETEPGWLWREEKMHELLTRRRPGPLFVNGCVSNQAKFYPHFDHVVLFSAPTPILLERIAKRTNNRYGKSLAERQEILGYIETVEPLLRRGADREINTAEWTADEIADQLSVLAQSS